MLKKILITVAIVNSFLWSQDSDKVKKILDNSGISIDQAKSIAKSKGMSISDIKKEAKKRGYDIEKDLNRGNDVLSPKDGIGTETNDIKKSGKPEEETLTDQETNDQESEGFKNNITSSIKGNSLIHFGYNVFNGNPKSFQKSNYGSIDPNYNIGPGDEIIIMLWGETQFRQVFTVSDEGFIFIPEVGQVFVNGLNLGQMEKKFSKILSKVYSSLNPKSGNPTTFLDVSLGTLRPLRIIVLGEVAQPGAYLVSPTATLVTSLYYFNGPTVRGSLRDIHLIRGGKKIVSIDFYEYLLSGTIEDDFRLQADDIIFIPKRGKTISIEGEITRSAIYELKENETLADLFKIASDLRPTAYIKHAQIDRIVPPEEREKLQMDRIIVDIDLTEILSGQDTVILFNGDRIMLNSILDVRGNTVEIVGSSVSRPGVYEIDDSLTVKGLVFKADSLLGDVYLNRADLIRTTEDLRKELVKINLGEALRNNSEHNLKLNPFDILQVYSKTELNPVYEISLDGHVKFPGTYSLLENLTAYDILFKYGGYEDKEWKEKTYLERADLIRFNDDNITQTIIKFNLDQLLTSSSSDQNFDLLPGDRIRVYSKNTFIFNQFVTVDGAIKFPGKYKFKSDLNLQDIILEAGGISDNVYKYRVEIARIDPNGRFNNNFAEVLYLEFDETVSSANPSENANRRPTRNSVKLKPFDFITIRKDPKFKFQKIVEIEGEVLNPGKFVILNQDETVTDIIARAGGVLETGYPFGSSFERDGAKIRMEYDKILKNPQSKLNFRVRDGDNIFIGKKSEIVSVAGEVNSPGLYKFIPGKRLKYYIKNSGGLSPDADAKNIYVQHPNGKSNYNKGYSLFSPKIYDGSVIYVSKKEKTEPLDKTEFAREIASIIGDLAQVIAMVLIAAN